MEICSVPLQIFFELPARHNILLAIIFLLNALSAFALMEYLTKDAFSSFLGGLFFSINPFVFYHLKSGRIQTACLFGIPLCVYCLFKVKGSGSGRDIILAALALFLNSLLYWYYSTFLLIFFAMFLLYGLISEKRNGPWAWDSARVLLLYGVLMLLLFAYPVLIKGGRPVGYGTPADFLNMTRFSSLHLLPASFLWRCLILASAAMLPAVFSKDNLFFALCAACFMILSLGPYLLIHGHAIPLPFILLHHHLPFFSRLWWPINCFAMVLLSAAVLLSSLTHYLFARIPARGRPVLMAALCTLLLFPYARAEHGANSLYMDVIPPFQEQAAYRYLSRQKECAIVELPFDKACDFMANQTVHEKRIFHAPGYGFKDILWPEAQLRLLHGNPFLAYADALCSFGQLLRSASPPPTLTKIRMRIGLQQLRALGFEFIVVQPRYAAGYPRGDAILRELRKTLRRPSQEYPDGVRLFKIQDLIENG
ncbi:MAG: hypothetical protein NTY77_12450 [Elusimicrobia bacterium]|nr:hypothetical protein [Elusimicrobiota bacterium]